MYSTVEEFITEFRRRIGDSTCDTPVNSIISWINTALRRLARSKGLDKLFTYHDTFELARINEDGTPAASWEINGGIGMLIDIKSLLVLDHTGCCMDNVTPCYMPLDWFRREHPFPERECAGVPCAFTINQMGGTTQVIFDRPIDSPLIFDMIYSAFPPKVSKLEDYIRIPYQYEDILMELVIILFNQEAQDYAFARSGWEEVDYFIAEARETLAHQHTGMPLRTVRGSF